MAIYHLSVKSGQQYGSSGSRGASHYAYIHRKGKYQRADLEYAESGNLPSWAKDAAHFWASADRHERINGRIYTELEIALPRELDESQRLALVREFVVHTLAQDFSYSFAIHCPIAADGEANPHVHLMFCERRLDGIERSEAQFFKRYHPSHPELGGAGKDRYFSSRGFVYQVRLDWANQVNDFCERLGLDARIDHRSYQAQGLELSSQNFRAEYISHHQYYIQENIQQIRQRNGEIIIERPSEAIRALTNTQSVLKFQEIERFLMAHTDGEAQYLKALEAVMMSPELMLLYGKDRVLFSSKDLVEIEASIATLIYNANTQSREIKYIALDDLLPLNALRLAEDKPFNAEQRHAYFTLTSIDRVALLNGAAGTGKSFVLKAVAEAFQQSDYQVYGIALQAITARSIAQDCGIESRTIHSFLARYDSGNFNMTNKTVLILDEAGMVGSRDLQRLLMIVEKHDAQLKLVGDSYQLNAVSAGSAFAYIQQQLDQKNVASLHDIQRQKHAVEAQKMLKASMLLSKHEVGEALDIYQSIGMVHEYPSQDVVLAKTLAAWQSNASDSKIMLAHSNSDVNELNRMTRRLLQQQGALSGESYQIQSAQGEMELYIGEKLVFKQNNSQLNIANGECAEVIAVHQDEFKQAHSITLRTQKDERLVLIDLNEYAHFKYGYAQTIHSSQGMTVDHAYVVAGEHMSANLAYVALTRHRHSVELNYASSVFETAEKEYVKRPDGRISYDDHYRAVEREITPFEQLKKVLGRSEHKAFSLDYSVVEHKDRFIQGYLQEHRNYIDEHRKLYGMNERLYSMTLPQRELSEAETLQEIRAKLKEKALMGRDLFTYHNEMKIAQGEFIQLTEDLTLKTGFFHSTTFKAGTELRVSDTYKIKDVPTLNVEIDHQEYEVPLNKINFKYSERYFTEFQQVSDARLTARHTTEIHEDFRKKLRLQKESAPQANLNTPQQQMKYQNNPHYEQNTPRMNF